MGQSVADYRSEFSYDGPQITGRLVRFGSSSDDLSSDRLLTLDRAGRPQELLFTAAGGELGRQLQIYGRDNKIVGAMRGWIGANGEFARAQLRIPEYDGQGRIIGLGREVTSDPSVAAGWEAFLRDSENTEALQADPSSVEGTAVSLGGMYAEYTRTPIGALTEESDATGIRYSANAIDTSTPTLVEWENGQNSLSPGWDERGRMTGDGLRELEWTGDSKLRRATVPQSGAVEERLYDAFGRAYGSHATGWCSTGSMRAPSCSAR